jgi:hypothetical protein
MLMFCQKKQKNKDATYLNFYYVIRIVQNSIDITTLFHKSELGAYK